MNHPIDKFTPASFLTQSANVKKKDLNKVDLLPKIVYRVMQIPEMAPTFNEAKEILMQNYALMARLLDGDGLVTAGGIHGERRVTGDYLFGLLGATTPLSQTAWNTFSKVGSRFLFLEADQRLTIQQRLSRSMDVMTGELHYRTKRKLARKAVADFVTFLLSQLEPTDYDLPELVPEQFGSKEDFIKHCGYCPRSVAWDSSRDDPKALEMIAHLAEFVTGCRQDVRVWSERADDGTTETNSTGAVAEGVERYTALTYNLARCHALISGRDGVAIDDIPLLIVVGLSILPDDRRKSVTLLIEGGTGSDPPGQFSTQELSETLSCSDKTAKAVMRKIAITGMGRVMEGVAPTPSVFKLRSNYDWFLSEEFRSLYDQWPRTRTDKTARSAEEEDETDVPF